MFYDTKRHPLRVSNILKVVGIAEVESELLELNGYTLTARWNNLFPRGHVFWRTGNFRTSLIEIGLNIDTHVLEDVHVVNIQRDWVSSVEIMDFDNPSITRKSGLPIIEWTWDRPSPYYVDERGTFNIHIASTHLSIRFGNAGKLNSVLVAERALFGIDDNNNLIAVQFVKLQPEEMTVIKSTFQRDRE